MQFWILALEEEPDVDTVRIEALFLPYFLAKFQLLAAHNKPVRQSQANPVRSLLKMHVFLKGVQTGKG